MTAAIRSDVSGTYGALQIGGADALRFDPNNITIPVVTTAQKTAITNRVGMFVFDSTLGKLCVNTGSGWQTVTSV